MITGASRSTCTLRKYESEDVDGVSPVPLCSVTQREKLISHGSESLRLERSIVECLIHRNNNADEVVDWCQNNMSTSLIQIRYPV